MKPEEFNVELYRRMSLRTGAVGGGQPPADSIIQETAFEYKPFLPSRKDAAILDVGYGDGLFLAACMRLGYTNISGAELAPERKAYMKDWDVKLYSIETEIGEFLGRHPNEYDFICMSHVIEHVPKYSLLWVMDALYQSLKKGGILFLRTPNMDGPCPNSSFYVTLSHEYGFTISNLTSLLSISGFDEIRFHALAGGSRSLKQRLAAVLRWPYVQEKRLRHRLFGAGGDSQFGTELVATAKRGDFPPMFSEKYR
jgi:2-polyprenyl-3-methyl-5-hydroxy-6-metoxy-1,4-benzoquinol methylase